MSTAFELLLVSVDPDLIRQVDRVGGVGVIVDWEREGKAVRQAGADTEINAHTVEDLYRVRACTSSTVVCRINAFHNHTPGEIECAIDAGADEVLLPMVRSTSEVERTLALVDGRCRVGILVETNDAVASAAALAALPLARVYVGLNDLAIERGSSTIFQPLVDGTLEELRATFDVPFGFGGLTSPERGSPIPCRLLIAETARLGCSFSFLRRAFHRDVAGRDPAVEATRILQALERERKRPSDVRAELELCVGTAAAVPVGA